MSGRVARIKEALWKPAKPERSPEEFFDDLGELLRSEGFPVWRMASVLVSHDPSTSATHLIWARGQATRGVPRSHEILQTDDFLGTPVERALTHGEDVHVAIDDEGVRRFPILADLRKSGGTDYFIMTIAASDGLSYANYRFTGRTWFSFATDATGGFSATDISDLEKLREPIGLRISLETSKQTARGLLRAYLGANAAKHVLDGQFQRGTGRMLRAVLWYCDMRGFTAMSDHRAPLEVVKLLDRYFDAVATPLEANGGEVLKFIGDAVLAIFPLDGDGGATGACARSLAATREAIARLEALNVELKAQGAPELGLGAALHVGEVAYGNIGASTRVDFTVIGAPVNEVCRVEPLTRSLGEPALLTRAFVDIAGVRARSLGRHALKGVSDEQEVFALPS